MGERREKDEKQRLLREAEEEAQEKKENEKKEVDELRIRVVQMNAESQKLKKEVIELTRMVDVSNHLLQLSRKKVEGLEANNEELKSDLARGKNHVDELNLIIRTLKQDDRSSLESTVAAQKVKIEEKDEKIQDLIKVSPTGGSRLKPFGELTTKEAIRSRCLKLIKCMVQLVGNDKDTLNSFIFHFVKFLSKSSEYEFCLNFSEWDSFYATIRWNLSNGFLREFQQFCKSRLAFGVFNSLHKTREMRKCNTVEEDYCIQVKTTIKTTRSEKEVSTSTAVVTARNIAQLVSRRLEDLATSGRLRVDDRGIVLGFGGDKGADTTKLSIVFENVENSNDPHGILLIGLYTGADNYSNLKANFESLFHQINNLKTVTYKVGDFEVTENVTIIPVGDCKFISALYNHSGQSSSEPCFRCHKRWINHGNNKATIGTFDFEETGQLRTIQKMKEEGLDPLLLVEPSHASPPGLHVFIGINQKYFIEYFIALAVTLDFKNDQLPINLKQQKKHLKTLAQEAKEYRRQMGTVRCTMERIESVAAVLPYNSLNQNPLPSPLACSSDHCIARSGSIKNLETFKCRCRKVFHHLCELNMDADDVHKKDSDLSCLECFYGAPVDLGERITILNEKKAAAENEYLNVSDAFTEVVEEQLNLEALLEKSAGETRRRMEALLISIGCDYRIWYQEMNGNQTRTILRPENIDKIVHLFQSIMEERGMDTEELHLMGCAMKDLGFLMSQADNSHKSDEEIDVIEKVVARFVAQIRILFIVL
ncbi:hypothetical protein GCK72_009507 [Caenorhabditis remanei]|uniref:Zinc finger PHD-type domain-containing protein n=1 Tax=Caenorhabditis remanei TaxID=31234 RepID=A0A6A5H410_CAERE|nr:hypothetical protein GCK72_009507 [Caenorhabditis remanei]KAF1761253.1 hypothetical protein GCK72_009507 [Caenorhabditis remanei]